ncbi:MAG TPA: hypothetical protein VMT10_07950 [Solirubrobacteraceae bacterium]|nr:hypothetical protein [Solirubrobacteraceae bacterium]
MPRFRLILALSLVAALALPAVASAHFGHRGFFRTYPHATILCAAVANGHAPKGLQGQTDKVTAACNQLNTDFTNAQNAFNAGVAPLKQQATDALKNLRTTCQQAYANNDPATCKAARQSTRTTLQGLWQQLKTLNQTYHTAVDTARKTFWATIKSLRGSSKVTPDTTTGPAPTTTLPAPSQANG